MIKKLKLQEKSNILGISEIENLEDCKKYGMVDVKNNSNNTDLLNVEQVKGKLLALNYINDELEKVK